MKNQLLSIKYPIIMVIPHKFAAEGEYIFYLRYYQKKSKIFV